MFEQDLQIAAKDRILAGTLCLPEQQGKFPLVLFVHGSGQLDRNENIKGQKLDVFNTLAHSLAKQGVASFRYDKRGVGQSTGNYFTAGHFDLVDDAMQCLSYLIQHEQCDETAIFLLGHSEGSIIVPQMTQQHIPVAGIIMLTPFIDNMESILMKQAQGVKAAAKQLKGVSGLLVKLVFKLFDPVRVQTRLIRKIKSGDDAIVYLMFKKIPAKWFRELFSLQPAAIYEKTTCPGLIIGGTKDVQCDPEDVAAISHVMQGDVESHLIKDMAHILRREPGKPSVFRYIALLKKPLEPQVSVLINDWVGRQVMKRP